MEEATTQDIIAGMRKAVIEHIPLSPHHWVEGGMRLTALLGNENDRYAELYQQAYKIQQQAILSDKTASVAEIEMKSSDAYKDLLKQKGVCEQVAEMIRLCKIRATLSDKELPLSGL